MPLLLTRIHEESYASASRLRRLGWSVYRAPLLRIRAVPCAHLLDELRASCALAITSKSALRVFPQVLLEHADIRSLRVHAVGEESAALARRKGFIDVRTADSDVDSLYENIMQQDYKKGMIVHLCGKHVSGNLVAKLQENGYNAVNITLYEAVAAQAFPVMVKKLIKRNRVYAYLIYSSRSADIFARLYASVCVDNRSPRVARNPLRFFCLSKAIGKRLARHFPRSTIVCAPKANENSLLQVLANYEHPPNLCPTINHDARS